MKCDRLEPWYIWRYTHQPRQNSHFRTEFIEMRTIFRRNDWKQVVDHEEKHEFVIKIFIGVRLFMVWFWSYWAEWKWEKMFYSYYATWFGRVCCFRSDWLITMQINHVLKKKRKWKYCSDNVTICRRGNEWDNARSAELWPMWFMKKWKSKIQINSDRFFSVEIV